MFEIKLTVDGMMCGMCESHVQDAIRNHATVKKVKASRKDGSVLIVSPEALSEEQIHQILDPTGYRVTAYSCSEK